LDSDLVREREMVIEWEQPEIGPVRQLGVPVKLSRTPGMVHAPAPAFGEHTEEVLRAAGFTDEEIGELLESGAAAGTAAEATEARFMG
jgi:crotonobetainyl-CoA:carnitine CoA-transferase CaiB-like acyl-CoA transferase